MERESWVLFFFLILRWWKENFSYLGFWVKGFFDLFWILIWVGVSHALDHQMGNKIKMVWKKWWRRILLWKMVQFLSLTIWAELVLVRDFSKFSLYVSSFGGNFVGFSEFRGGCALVLLNFVFSCFVWRVLIMGYFGNFLLVWSGSSLLVWLFRWFAEFDCFLKICS